MISEVFNMDYDSFLKNKTKKTLNSGFDIDESELNNNLFPFPTTRLRWLKKYLYRYTNKRKFRNN